MVSRRLEARVDWDDFVAKPALSKFLVDVAGEKIADGRPHKVGRLVAEHQGQAEIGGEQLEVGADEARGVLEAVYAYRGLSIVDPPGPSPSRSEPG